MSEQPQKAPSLPLVKAEFDMEAAKINYQELLYDISQVTITKDNVNQDHTKAARAALKLLTELKDEKNKAPLQWQRDNMAAYRSLFDPLKEQVDRVGGETKVVATQIKEEGMKQMAEQQRIANAQNAIIEFTNKVAVMISQAKTDSDIVGIEKMIGSEKTKTTVYQEFIGELSEKCDAMRPQIKEQKDLIRELQKLKETEAAALETGDVAAAASLIEKREYLEQAIKETSMEIHDTAFKAATSITVVAPEVMDSAPKGRINWKWRVDDIKTLYKKMPHLVQLVPDKQAIDSLLATKRADGSLKDKEEETIHGLTFYNDRIYK